jgi:hypothetical protein
MVIGRAAFPSIARLFNHNLASTSSAPETCTIDQHRNITGARSLESDTYCNAFLGLNFRITNRAILLNHYRPSAIAVTRTGLPGMVLGEEGLGI